VKKQVKLKMLENSTHQAK